MKLTQALVKELLSYDPLTGVFLWKEREVRAAFARTDRGWNSRRAGTMAGCVNPSDGYVQIYVHRTRYAAHRLAFLIETGAWPKDQVDHINGSRADNRWVNLRDCSAAENNRNAGPLCTNTSGFKGVFTATKGLSWFAQIGVNGKQHYLGSFPTKQEAAAAYDNAAMSLHGEFARLNAPVSTFASGVTP